MDPYAFLPLSEASFYILLSLSSEAKHGYAIWKDVESLSNGSLKLSTSTLYDALERLLQQGLINRVKEESQRNRGRPRKMYRLNEIGKQVLVMDLNRMRRLLELANPRLQDVPQ
jgi:DNA-binding PadR family transcriptional regulator